MTVGVTFRVELKFVDLFVHVHEQQRRKLTHPLTVTDLRVIHRVCSENVKQ